jgi:hypothetical protein
MAGGGNAVAMVVGYSLLSRAAVLDLEMVKEEEEWGFR